MAKMTKKWLNETIRKSTQYGYFHDTENNRLWTKCPVCRENVYCQGYVRGDKPGRRTVPQMLKAGMEDHLTNHCSECPELECGELRGDHTSDCPKRS